MKQILYKVWDFEQNCWIEDSTGFDDWHLGFDGRVVLIEYDSHGPEEIDYNLDRFGILLGTGCKDKNSKDIYDGHIVKLSYGIPPTSDILVIEYADDKIIADISISGWWMRNIRHNGVSSSLCKTYENDLEIIGHKHTHSHLLKEIKGK